MLRIKLVKVGTLLFATLSILSFLTLALAKEDSKVCFECHTQFAERDYLSSVHGQFSCFLCHKGLDVKGHIKEKKKEREVFRGTLNRECFECHDVKSISAIPQHASSSLNVFFCSDCHDPHLTKSVKADKVKRAERLYCLTCHGKRDLRKRLKSGEELSLYVDEKEFLKSSHGKNQCSFCHLGFSKGRHPKTSYGSKRELSERISPTACARCHIDECRRYERCVHAAASKKRGDRIAPVCSDCHNPHYVKIEKDSKDLHLTTCAKCHADVDRAYRESVHYKAWEKGNKNAPLCTGCHKPHEVLVTSFDIRNNEVCLDCHKGIEKAHTTWFYNPPFRSPSFVKFHLESITCNVCHGKEKKGAVYLYPYDRVKKTPLRIERMRELLGVEGDKLNVYLDANRDGYLNADELWALFNSLTGRKVSLTFLGWMDVRDPVLSHLTEPKDHALRSCEVCHRADSPFFKDAFVVFRDRYGWPTVFKAHKDVLSTKSALTPLSQFYVFGSTRLLVTDFLLVVAIFGAILVPSIHIFLRISTRRWRKKGNE